MKSLRSVSVSMIIGRSIALSKKQLVNEMDVKSITVSTRSEKRTFRVPLTQDEHSDMDCLSLFVAWPALHAW